MWSPGNGQAVHALEPIPIATEPAHGLLAFAAHAPAPTASATAGLEGVRGERGGAEVTADNVITPSIRKVALIQLSGCVIQVVFGGVVSNVYIYAA